MIETGAYGDRMAGYLHIAKSPIHAKLGSGRSELAVTRLHAPNGFSEPTSPIPLEKAYSIHLHLRANHGGRLWLSGKLVPTGKRPSGGVTILDLEQDPIAFFPNPIDVVQFYIPCQALEEFAYENRITGMNALAWPHCEMDVRFDISASPSSPRFNNTSLHRRSFWITSVTRPSRMRLTLMEE